MNQGKTSKAGMERELREQSAGRLFAVIPAAGASRRMGRAKLLLPLGGRPVIARLLEVLDCRAITARVVVIRPDDEALAEQVSRSGATLLRPRRRPAEMRTSVELALQEIRRRFQPRPEDGWLLIPADHPMLSAAVLEGLIAAWEQSDGRIAVPTYQGRRGHPTFFRWDLAEAVPRLAADQGLNALLQIHAEETVEMPCDDPAVLTDLDTPADYEKLAKRWEEA